jgi:TonB family protein
MHVFRCAVLVIIMASPAFGSTGVEEFAVARGLYASADYPAALAILDRLSADGALPAEALSIQQYRALCLLALGKVTEAETAIAAIVAAAPAYRTTGSDTSPRLQTTFLQIRQRTLPVIIQQKYAAAKVQYDGHAYALATAGFREVLALLDDPDVAGVATRPPLSDLRVLASGFSELGNGALVATAAPPASAAAPAAASVVAAASPRNADVYSAARGEAIPPVVISQTLPRHTGRVTTPLEGAIEVIIDETGAVTTATMRKPTNTVYDRVALAAARAWKYQAATVGGSAVKYKKLVAFTLAPAP